MILLGSMIAFKLFFTRKYIKIILYNFLKIIFYILKRPNNKKKKLKFNETPTEREASKSPNFFFLS